jgi:hypothetical protein
MRNPIGQKESGNELHEIDVPGKIEHSRHLSF